MKRGERICNELKAVRRHIADENGIELHQEECKHTGDCRGTCPKCEAEVRCLEIVSFIIEKDGSIGSVIIRRDIGFGCGKEAARVVKMMPKWNPAKNNGKPVRFEFNLPIEFSIK